MREEEIGLARAADVTLAITPEEKASILAAAPQAVVKVLPNVFDLPPRTHPPLADRHGLFFIGGFWHRPNSDGIRWFVDAILPLIRAELPEVGLTIAGSNMDDAILALGARPGVTVAGFVPELQPVFDRHRVFVAPLRFGAGMKGKVAQSLLHGLPAVATGIGAEGMGLVHGTHILVAEEAADFAQEVVSLLRDDALWERLAARGRQHIETTLSREAVKPQLEAVFRG
jgi:glycosyltransferase involved in cell wall biosynthesis